MNLIPQQTLQDQEAAALDAAAPAHQNAKTGSRIQVLERQGDYIMEIVLGADYHTNALNFTADVSGELIDAWCVGNAASASGTATLRRSTTAMTSALTMAVQDALSRTASIVQAQKMITQGETLNVITNGAGDRGVLYIAIKRT